MTFEGFRTTVATNPVPIVKQSINEWAEDSITYACVTVPRLDRIKRNLPVVLPHVDRAVFVLGQENPEAFAYLDTFKPKVDWVYHPWQDSFAKQYDQYLKRIKGGWVLLCDDDELPSEGMLRSLRELVKLSEGGTKFGLVEFRSNDVSFLEGYWNERVDNGPCEYYRQMFFKWFPDMHYDIALHQSLQGARGPAVRCTEHYYHIKSTKDEYRNACRNWFIAGEWPSGPRSDGIRTAEWHELQGLVAKHYPEIKYFSDFNNLLETATVHPDIKDWIRRNKDARRGEEGETANEMRAYYKYYFEILHPEEA